MMKICLFSAATLAASIASASAPAAPARLDCDISYRETITAIPDRVVIHIDEFGMVKIPTGRGEVSGKLDADDEAYAGEVVTAEGVAFDANFNRHTGFYEVTEKSDDSKPGRSIVWGECTPTQQKF